MPAQKFELTVQKRELLGKKTKHLRKVGLIPANIYGDVKDSLAVTLNTKEFRKVYQEAGETNLVYIKIEGEQKARPILVDKIDADPISGQVLHVSLRQVDLKEKVTAEIPVEFVGELSVDDATALLIHPVIEIEALPTDLIESFVIDLSNFTEIDQQVLVNQLQYDSSKITISLDPEEPVVQIQKIEEMAEPVEETSADEGLETPGEQGAEGEAQDAVKPLTESESDS